MNICVKCRKEMFCLKTGSTAHFGHGHCYAGDIFKCKDCGSEVLVCVTFSHQADVELLKDNNCSVVDMTGRQ